MNLKWLILLLGMAVITACPNDVNQQFDVVQIDTETEFRVIDGFGTSMINYKEFPPRNIMMMDLLI